MLQQMENQLKASHVDYSRELFWPYFTAPEWRNVEISKEFSKCLLENKPFYRFNYFTQIKEFWYVFFKSFQAANKYTTKKKILLSEYMIMNLFIGTATTVELFSKGHLALAISSFLKIENPTSFQTSFATPSVCIKDEFGYYVVSGLEVPGLEVPGLAVIGVDASFFQKNPVHIVGFNAKKSQEEKAPVLSLLLENTEEIINSQESSPRSNNSV